MSATVKELQFATLNVLPFVYNLSCSCQCIVLSHSPCERIGKWETCLSLKEDRTLVHVYLE
jgi:hypothetical protein